MASGSDRSFATPRHVPLFRWPIRHRPRTSPPPEAGLPPQLIEIAALERDAALALLDTSERGLAANEVARRRDRFGINAIGRVAHETLAMQLLRRLLNPLNALLLTVAAISLTMRDERSALIVLSMVGLSISLAAVQERRSSRAAEQLRAMVHTTATVTRRVDDADRAETHDVPAEMLVPGDIVHLSAGDIVPSDLRLVVANTLFVNESSLTGESLPVEKHAAAIANPSGDVSALSNVCFMGTSVVSGGATGVIVLTGAHAYFGGIAHAAAVGRELSSFDRGVNRFAWLMLTFIAVMAPLVFLINGLTKGNWVEALLFATAVAVGLTPEMLPMIVTVNLAKGALEMSRRKVVVKRLDAIQNLGAMDVLCTDKTGTLTQDRVILQKHVDLSGNDSAEVLELAYLNSFYQSGLKNLLDVAVLQHADAEALAQKASVYRKIDEAPFDFERRRMSVAVEGEGRRLLICKGAVEEVFQASRTGTENGTPFELDETHLTHLRATSEALNADGFRVIAVACKELPADKRDCSASDECDLVLVGYIAFLDPPKESAGRAIANLAARGVRVKVLTGDNDVITRKICRDVALPFDRIVLGHELESCSDAERAALVENAQVFARLSPNQKATVIRALQARGHVVGFLGDGINDGPALKAADVGVSVDTAVDIAKDSADVILLEKSLLVLGDGVVEGRKVFANIVKYIRMGASSNFGNMLSVVGASAWLPFLPMAPVQVLTNNLLYDLSQTAIPTDNVDDEYIATPRRWEIGNVGRFMLFIGPLSSIFDYATYFAMYYLFNARTVADAALFQTGWFVESLLSQTLIIHIIRTRRLAFIESRASTPLLLTSLAVCAIGLWLPYSPFADSLGFTRLPALYWPLLALLLLGYLVLTHAMKMYFHRRFGLD